MHIYYPNRHRRSNESDVDSVDADNHSGLPGLMICPVAASLDQIMPYRHLK